MEAQNQWEGLETAALIPAVLLLFYTWFYTAHSQEVKRLIERVVMPGNSDLFFFVFRKFSGFLILGVVPALVYFGVFKASGEKFGLTFYHLKSSFILIAGLVLLTALILFVHHKRKTETNTLQMNPAEWNIPMFVINALGWSLYLIGYEFLFRGILLFECYDMFGFWPAVAINVTIYSAIHMVNGKEQAIGALIFGFLACYFALVRETLLIPVFMHLSLSILSDYYSIRKQQRLGPVHHNNLNSISG